MSTTDSHWSDDDDDDDDVDDGEENESGSDSTNGEEESATDGNFALAEESGALAEGGAGARKRDHERRRRNKSRSRFSLLFENRCFSAFQSDTETRNLLDDIGGDDDLDLEMCKENLTIGLRGLRSRLR